MKKMQSGLMNLTSTSALQGALWRTNIPMVMGMISITSIIAILL